MNNKFKLISEIINMESVNKLKHPFARMVGRVIRKLGGNNKSYSDTARKVSGRRPFNVKLGPLARSVDMGIKGY